MTNLDLGIGLLAAAACLAAIGLAVRANRNRPAFYRVFLLLFFTVWSAVLWLQPRAGQPEALIPSLALLAAAIAVGFVPLPPPNNRRQTKNLLDLLETERSLERFFASRPGRLFWPVLAILIFSVCLRLSVLAGSGAPG